MIVALIFALHIFFMIYIFTQKWQRESVAAGITNVIFIIILFSVGWSLLTLFMKLFVPAKGFGIHLDRDAIILLTLTIGEYFFYRVYYREDRGTIEDDTEKQ